MATENLGKLLTVPAGSDLSAKQWYAMTVNSSGQLAVAAAGGANARGILQDKPNAAGRAGSLMIGTGLSMAVAGAAANVGDQGTTDPSGRMVTAVSGDTILGFFMEAPTAANQVVSFVWQKGGTL